MPACQVCSRALASESSYKKNPTVVGQAGEGSPSCWSSTRSATEIEDRPNRPKTIFHQLLYHKKDKNWPARSKILMSFPDGHCKMGKVDRFDPGPCLFFLRGRTTNVDKVGRGPFSSIFLRHRNDQGLPGRIGTTKNRPRRENPFLYQGCSAETTQGGQVAPRFIFSFLFVQMDGFGGSSRTSPSEKLEVLDCLDIREAPIHPARWAQ